MKFCSYLLVLVFTFASAIVFAPANVNGDIIEFIAEGTAGTGLLAGNIAPSTSSTGSGAIGNGGIFFDTDTNELTVDILWGSENGFSDLTGDVILLHLHGPVDPGQSGWGQVNTNILVQMQNSLNFDSSGSGGSLVETFFLDDQQEEWLLDSRTYINVHTDLYPTGEIRGYLTNTSAVPEPTSVVLLVGLAGTFLIRRRRLS